MRKLEKPGKRSKIYVAGGNTCIGAAILRELARQGYENVVNLTSGEPDLTSASETEDFFAKSTPEYVFLAAGKSGGIGANRKYPADLMRDNLLVECTVIGCAWRFKVKKLLYLSSSCSYPRECPQPMKPEHLFSGPLEPTNVSYAVAKMAGIVLCQAYRIQYRSPFICAIPANSFGPGDDFSPEDSHVVAALLQRIHEAKVRRSPAVEIWGTGSPIRDFLFVDDLANACVFLMEKYDGSVPLNIGSGSGISIRELADRVRETVEYNGELVFNAEKPDGMPVKVLDTCAIASMGWVPRTDLGEALRRTYDWFLQFQKLSG